MEATALIEEAGAESCRAEAARGLAGVTATTGSASNVTGRMFVVAKGLSDAAAIGVVEVWDFGRVLTVSVAEVVGTAKGSVAVSPKVRYEFY